MLRDLALYESSGVGRMLPTLVRGVCARSAGLLPRGLKGRSIAGPVRSAPAFKYVDLFTTEKPKETPYKLLTTDHVSTFEVNGEKMLKVRA